MVVSPLSDCAHQVRRVQPGSLRSGHLGVRGRTGVRMSGTRDSLTCHFGRRSVCRLGPGPGQFRPPGPPRGSPAWFERPRRGPGRPRHGLGRPSPPPGGTAPGRPSAGQEHPEAEGGHRGQGPDGPQTAVARLVVARWWRKTATPATTTTTILTMRTVFQADEASLTVRAPMFQKPGDHQHGVGRPQQPGEGPGHLLRRVLAQGADGGEQPGHGELSAHPDGGGQHVEDQAEAAEPVRQRRNVARRLGHVPT